MKRLLILLFLFPAFAPAAEPKPKHGMGYKALPPAQRAALHADRAKAHGHRIAALASAATPPAEFDVKDMGWAGDPGDQADCGSCYLYSTCKTATGAFVKAGYGKIDLFRLSTQYGMDCPTPGKFGGCDGGNGTEVIDWMVKNGWLAEADPSQEAKALYPPYVAAVRTCRSPSGAKKYTPADWLFVTSDQGDHPATVAEIKAALMAYGRTKLGTAIDHEINVRGWSDAKQAFLLENQWKPWGGAKTAGDGCCWLAYSAVGQLQDPFVVSAAALPPIPPPVPPTPPPGPGPLFTLTFNKAIAKGGLVWFTAPTAIPAGAKLLVYPAGSLPALLGDSPFEEQATQPMKP